MALIAAVKRRSLSDVQRLVETAEWFEVDVDGNTPIHWASFLKEADILNVLMTSNLQKHAENVYGENALMFAFRNNIMERNKNVKIKTFKVVTILLKHNLSINRVNAFGDSTLHLAVKAAAYNLVSKKCISLLLDFGADSRLENEKGQTAAKCAYEYKLADVGVLISFHEPQLVRPSITLEPVLNYVEPEESYPNNIKNVISEIECKEELIRGIEDFQTEIYNQYCVYERELEEESSNEGLQIRMNELREFTSTAEDLVFHYHQQIDHLRVVQAKHKRRDRYECPICMEDFQVEDEIYQCNKGHIFCADCKNKISSFCPTCRVNIDCDIRNRVLEDILRSQEGE